MAGSAQIVRVVPNAAVVAQIMGALNPRLDRLSSFITGYVFDHISQYQSPPHSSPGEYPHIMYGPLHQNMFWERDGNGAWIIGTRTPGDYCYRLEIHMGRPYLTRGLFEVASSGDVARILGGP